MKFVKQRGSMTGNSSGKITTVTSTTWWFAENSAWKSPSLSQFLHHLKKRVSPTARVRIVRKHKSLFAVAHWLFALLRKTKVLCYQNTRNKKQIKLVRERVKVAFGNASFVCEVARVSVARDTKQSSGKRRKMESNKGIWFTSNSTRLLNWYCVFIFFSAVSCSASRANAKE
jgi:hypothetical protein